MGFPDLEYFTASEFGFWADYMDAGTLKRLDAFRREWGAPVHISPVDGALGRRMPHHRKSMHNVTRWGKVLAIDIFPEGLVGQKDMLRAVRLALKVGFRGVGAYPDWRFGAHTGGLHVDSRDIPQIWPDWRPPALWGRYGREYGPIDAALSAGIGARELIAELGVGR
ncbi:MAG: hypothetical protein ABNH53_01315 [Henriciella sp.]|jgi:hypothetical protein